MMAWGACSASLVFPGQSALGILVRSTTVVYVTAKQHATSLKLDLGHSVVHERLTDDLSTGELVKRICRQATVNSTKALPGRESGHTGIG